MLQGEGNEVKIGVVIDMVTSDEMSRGGLANDLLEVELLNEEGWEDAEEEGPVGTGKSRRKLFCA
jgi:hypothetical protein